MNMRRNVLLQGLIVVVLTLGSSVTVRANDPETTVVIEGEFTVLTGNVSPAFVPNELVRLPNSLIGVPGPGGFEETFRFDPGTETVQSGGTFSWTNTTDAPHTITVVMRSQQPKNLNAAFACFAPTGACGAAQAKHFPNGFDPITRQPIPPVVLDVGGLAVGDTHLIGPAGGPLRTTFQTTVNAPAGTKIFYMCSFHPQMQGVVVVEGD
jgi:plastocyanin